MTEEQRALALAAIDPHSAIKVGPVELTESPEYGDPWVRHTPKDDPALTIAVEVETPPPYKRWRFFLFYMLVRLAAWVYPFKFEIYRTPKAWERQE